MSDSMNRLSVILGTAFLVLSVVAWMVRSGLNRPMSFPLTVLPVAVGVLLISVGVIAWAVAA